MSTSADTIPNRWALRPGRSLAVLQAVALWPIWIGAVCFDRVLRSAPASVGSDIWIYRCGIALLGLVGLTAYMVRHPRGLAASARWGVAPLGRLIAVGLLFAFAGFRWRGLELDLMLVGGIAAAVGGAAYLTLGLVVSQWPGGKLVRTDAGPVLEGRRCRYVLRAWPAGCAEGERLWLPSLQLERSGNGPYRRGRLFGRSAQVVRDRDGLLVLRLLHHGLLLETWAMTTFAWVALSRLS